MFSQLADEMNPRVRFSSPVLHAMFLFPGFWKEGLEIGTVYKEKERKETTSVNFQMQFFWTVIIIVMLHIAWELRGCSAF